MHLASEIWSLVESMTVDHDAIDAGCGGGGVELILGLVLGSPKGLAFYQAESLSLSLDRLCASHCRSSYRPC